MKLKKLLIEICVLLKRFFRKKRREVSDDFKSDLHMDAMRIANEELSKKMEYGNHLDELLKKLEIEGSLSSTEALSVGYIRIDRKD